METPKPSPARDFIREIIAADVAEGKNGGRVHTRFPPEPNGYLHIGHAKAISLDFGVALEYPGGKCNLRMDDTNPTKEEQEYVDGIVEDIHWLGFDWQDRFFFASDYYERFYDVAELLIQKGKAYVDDSTAEEIRTMRGTLTEPGQASLHRDRSAAESLDLFRRMRAGEFPDGTRVLRAKIDIASPNINLRDPVLYRILHATHHRTGERWCIYPMYDYAHPLSDAFEGVTHSLCTLEFEDHRPLYDWVVRESEVVSQPRQIEFAPLILTYTVLSKRRLLLLVREGHVSGWDDPRMPTLKGLRRRGVTPESLRAFCEEIGLAKRESVVDIALLEHCLREDLNRRAPRVMAVLKPLRVVLENYPEEKTEELDAVNNPEDPSAGSRKVPFSRVLYIEQDDFREVPPPKYHRLSPGTEVRLRYGYIIRCAGVDKDDAGNVVGLRCTYDPETRSGSAPDGRKVKATVHWVSAAHALDAEVRLYNRMYTRPDPLADRDADFRSFLNPDSLEVLSGVKVEPSLAAAAPGAGFQFERQGYFCVDSVDSRPDRLVFNRTVTLRDTWAKIEKSGKG